MYYSKYVHAYIYGIWIYSRTSTIWISIIWTLGYLNAISNFEIPKRPFDFLQNQVINKIPVWFLDLLDILYHSTVGWKAY